MKIVLIDKENSGGIEIYNRRLIRFITTLGHEAYIIRFSKRKIKQKHVYTVPYYIGEERTIFTPFPSEKTLSMIRTYLQQIKPDIVYTCIGLSPFDFLFPSLCHELNIPIVGVWHVDLNDSSSIYNRFMKSSFSFYMPFCKRLDLLHVFSEKLKSFYVNKGINSEKIAVISNGIDTSYYTPGISSFAKKYDFKNGVLFIGRLTFQKNPELLIKAFFNSNPPIDTKLVIMGGGDQENRLKEKYQDQRIIFTGFITNEKEKLDIIRSCQIFVQPSRLEGLSLALLEAMSCNLACIVSDAGSNGELVKDAGISIPTDKLSQQLPVALSLCLQYPEFIKMLGKKARRKVIKYYTEKNTFAMLLQLFNTTIDTYQKKSIVNNKKTTQSLRSFLPSLNSGKW